MTKALNKVWWPRKQRVAKEATVSKEAGCQVSNLVLYKELMGNTLVTLGPLEYFC